MWFGKIFTFAINAIVVISPVYREALSENCYEIVNYWCIPSYNTSFWRFSVDFLLHIIIYLISMIMSRLMMIQKDPRSQTCCSIFKIWSCLTTEILQNNKYVTNKFVTIYQLEY